MISRIRAEDDLVMETSDSTAPLMSSPRGSWGLVANFPKSANSMAIIALVVLRFLSTHRSPKTVGVVCGSTSQRGLPRPQCTGTERGLRHSLPGLEAMDPSPRHATLHLHCRQRLASLHLAALTISESSRALAVHIPGWASALS